MKQIYANNFTTLALGRQGENLARQVVFDIRELEEVYGPGTVEVIYQRPGDELPYPVAVQQEGTLVTWTITAADTEMAGSHGKCELRYYVGETLAKSKIWRTWVDRALDTPSETAPPEPEQGWVDKVLKAGQAAVDASVNSPKIGSNGNWWTWDFEAGKYVDTGVAASGGSSAVFSVNGQTGAVVLTAGDVGAATAERVEQLAGEVGGKQPKYAIKTAMDSIAEPHTQYYLGEQATVEIVLPDNAEVGQIITACWYNGETAATMSITGTMLDFDYTPSANSRSEINALWDGLNWAVLANEMAVVADA